MTKTKITCVQDGCTNTLMASEAAREVALEGRYEVLVDFCSCQECNDRKDAERRQERLKEFEQRHRGTREERARFSRILKEEAARKREGQKLVSLVYKLEYEEYLETPEWKERARQCKEDAEHRCEVCNGQEGLQAHHRTYENLGCEEPGDLTALCKNCHQLFTEHGRLAKHSQGISREMLVGADQ